MVQFKDRRSIFIGIFTVFALINTIYIFIVNQPDTIHVKKETIEIEYGDRFRESVIYDNITNKDLPDDLKYTITPNIKGNVYPSCGTYQCLITGDQLIDKMIKIVVKDTTPPDITNSKPLNIELKSPVDLEEYFSIDDKSDYSVKIIDDDLNKYQAGQYTITVQATDEYENTASKDFTVTVINNEDNKPARNEDGAETTDKEYNDEITSRFYREKNDINPCLIIQFDGEINIDTDNRLEIFDTLYNYYKDVYNLDAYAKEGKLDIQIYEGDLCKYTITNEAYTVYLNGEAVATFDDYHYPE